MINKKLYIVTGLPRSGTSLVAGILHNLGVDMLNGQSVRQDSRNPTGYFEQMQVVNINANLTNSKSFVGVLESADKINSGHVFDVIPDVYNNTLHNMFEKDSNLIGTKDPRFCFHQLLSAFLTAVQVYISLENVKVLLAYRDIFSIAKSMMSVDEKVVESNLDIPSVLLQTYVDTIRLLIDESCDYKLISYERLVFFPRDSVQQIADFCDVPITPQAISLVDQKLKRF